MQIAIMGDQNAKNINITSMNKNTNYTENGYEVDLIMTFESPTKRPSMAATLLLIFKVFF